MAYAMNRRDFIKCVGVAGVFSLIGTIPLHASVPSHSDAEGLRGPFDLAFDPSGNLIVTDPSNYRVVRLDPSNRPSGWFGKPGSGVGLLNFPKGLAVDADGLIYVVDSNNCRVQAFDANGLVKLVLGSVGSIGGCLSTPQGVFADKNGRVLVADTRNHRIQIFRRESLIAVIGELGDGQDQFRLPTACAMNSRGDIVVLDSKHGMVKIFGKDLKFKSAFGGPGKSPGMLNMPQGMDLDEAGAIWVADTGNHRIQGFHPNGKVFFAAGKEGAGPHEFKKPTGIACRGDKIFVADNGNGRIQVFARP
jgi:tripartite motif-containing protein 71